MIKEALSIIRGGGRLWPILRNYDFIRTINFGLTFIHRNVTRRFYRTRSSEYRLLDVFLCPEDVYWWMRHATVANHIHHWKWNSILNVGSGKLGIAPFLDTKDKLVCTLDRELTSMKEKETSFVRGDAINLPFKDNSFDVVCSLAVLP